MIISIIIIIIIIIIILIIIIVLHLGKAYLRSLTARIRTAY